MKFNRNEINRETKKIEKKIIENEIKSNLTTDNPLSNRGAKAICCRVFFLSVAEAPGRIIISLVNSRC